MKDPMAQHEGPPGVRLIVDDRAVNGVQGSYVWRGRAVDRGPSIPTESLDIAVGELLKFESEGVTADEVSLSVYRRDDLFKPSLNPVWEGEIQPDTLTWSVELEPGSYIIALFQAWKEGGDVTHFFRIDVQSRE
jgi:hypothetical protein